METTCLKLFDRVLNELQPLREPVQLHYSYHNQCLQFRLESDRVPIKCTKSKFYKACNETIRNDEMFTKVQLLRFRPKLCGELVDYCLEYSQTHRRWCCGYLKKFPKKFATNFLILNLNVKKQRSSSQKSFDKFLSNGFKEFFAQKSFLTVSPQISKFMSDELKETSAESVCKCEKLQCEVIKSSILDIVQGSTNNIFQEKCLAILGAETMAQFARNFETATQNICAKD